MTVDRSQSLPIGKLPARLLSQLISGLGATDPDVLVGAGLGRDAAAIAFGDRILVAKTDPITFASTNPAAYLVDVNANDLACLGATPRWLLITALLPEGITSGEVELLFADLNGAARGRGIAIVGGHTEITAGLDRTILVGMLMGEATAGTLLRPGRARPGDHLLLANPLAIEGTALLAGELPGVLGPRVGQDMVDRANALLTNPGISIVPEARTMIETGGVTGLHDVTEGGLAMAVHEIASASGLGAVVDACAVPVLPETTAVAQALGLDPLGMLGSGSLLATVDPDQVNNVIVAGEQAGFSVANVGHLHANDDQIMLQRGDTREPMPRFDTDEVSQALNMYRTGGNDHS